MHDTSNQNPWIMTAHGLPSSFDEREVRRALALLLDPGATHELRGLPSGRLKLVRGDSLDDAIRTVEELSDGKGVYFTINPCDPKIVERHAEGKGVRNQDVTSRRLLYIDVDPVRPKGTNATESEQASAKAVAEAIVAELDGAGWPRPILVDSGSGWHLYYAVDLPNDPLSQSIISKFLKALKSRHDTPGAEVDPTVHNASRISRLPGTWNRKGVKSTEDRPYRLCRIVSVPREIEAVGLDELKLAAGLPVGDEEGGKPQSKSSSPVDAYNPWLMRADDHSDAYAKSALEREVGKVATAASLRNNTLHIAAVSLGTLVGAGRLDELEVRDKLTRASIAAGLGGDGDPSEIDRAITNGLEYGKQHPRASEAGEHKATAESVGATTNAVTGERTYPFPLIIKGSSIVPKKVDWLWPDRVPIGFLTLLAGRTSVGKSFVTFDFVARLTSGDELPDAIGGEILDPCSVLIISEDSSEYVIAPRLIELGADMDRVSVMTFEAMARFDLANIDMLDDLYAAAGEPRLVVIDPPTNFLGAKDEHKNAVVRGVLMGISIWTMRHELACVMITHCNKGIKKDMSALDRIIGSVAWASTSRLAHILAPDPDDITRCLFVPLKNNIGELARGLAYRVRKTDACAVVDWLGPVEMTGDQALYGDAKPRRITAAEWLIERFKERLEWESDDLFRTAKESGISRNAIFEAKQSLNLPRARQHIAEDGSKTFYWWVPPDWPLLKVAKGETS